MGNKTVMRLAILIGVIALVGGGGYFLWAFQVEKMAHGVVARADAAEKEGKYAEAEELYTRAPGRRAGRHRGAAQVCRGDPEDQEVVEAAEEALAIFEGVLRGTPGRRRAAAGGGDGRRDGRVREGPRHLDDPAEDGQGRRPSRVPDGPVRASKRRSSPAPRSTTGPRSSTGPRSGSRPSQRRAILLRDKLGEKEEADKVIDAMVKSAPGDYRVYLGRGRYRRARRDEQGGRRRLPQGAGAGPGPARGLPGGRRRGESASRGSTRPAQVLDKGLAAAPKVVKLYRALRRPRAEGRPGRPGDRDAGAGPEGIARGAQPPLATGPAPGRAGRGDGRLLLQIAELERLGSEPPVHPVSEGILPF